MITLNLIPPAIKNEYQSSEQLHHWLNAVIALTVTVVIATGASLGIWIMLGRHADAVKADLRQLEQHQATSNGKDITATTGQLNTTIKLLSTALGTPRSWGHDAVTVFSGLPSSITITTLTIQLNGQFHLVGIADSRQSFVQLESALKANPQLSNIATTSTASKRIDVPFDFSGQLGAKPTP